MHTTDTVCYSFLYSFKQSICTQRDTVCYSFLYTFKQSVCTQRIQFVIHFCTVSSSQYAHNGYSLLFISVQVQAISMHIADTVCYSFLYSFK